jgi:hypothetical protein
MMADSAPEFATFWRGCLSPLEAACLTSYARRGYRLVVFSYELLDLPEGIEAADARDIAAVETSTRFIFNGRPNLSHFTDYFRYQLFSKTNFVWVDADMLLLRPIAPAFERDVIALERSDSVCGAIMRLAPGARLTTLIEKTESKMDHDLLWGETGPKLLTSVFGIERVQANAFQPEIFFPIGDRDVWKILLPEYREECEVRAQKAIGLHLWNNIIDQIGYWKELAPPEGSFLRALFVADGSEKLFRDAYPVSIMRQNVENFRLRKSGEDLGIKQITRQILPSINRTWKYYHK